MKRLNVILKYIGDALLFAFAFTTFLILVSVLGTTITVIVGLIGKWIGIGRDIFIYAVLFIAFGKAWDALAWVVGKIANRVERKKIKNFYEG